jgi:hypothetical protein
MKTPDINKRCAELLGWTYKLIDGLPVWAVPADKSKFPEGTFWKTIVAVKNFNSAEDIKDAWMLIEFAWKKGFYVEVGQQNISGEYQCMFEHKEIRDNWWASVEKTAPLAISLAFIKSQEGE